MESSYTQLPEVIMGTWYKSDDERKRSQARTAMYPSIRGMTGEAGLRRGFNGNRKPRLSSAEHTSLMTVYRPNGDTFIVKGTKRRAPRKSSVTLKANTRRTVVTGDAGMSYSDRLARFGAIGNID
jgi:hypothetical protein